MEHIYSCSGEVSELQFPCLVSELDTISNRKCDWLEYPKARDFDFEKIQYRQWEKFPARGLATFLQDWLFFGLLRAILPEEIDLRVGDFIRTDDRGERYITTRKLVNDYLKPWEEILGKLPRDEIEALTKRNHRILKEASKLCYHLSELPSAPGLHLFPPLSLECVLPCALLGYALSITNASPNIGGLVWTTGDLIAEQMELQGWCPFIVSGIAHSHEIATRCYFTTLGGPKQKKARNHARCTDTLCYQTQVKDAQHTTLHCACAMLPSPAAVVAKAIRDKLTPLLKYEPATSFAPSSLGFGLSNSSSPYVAISHVWCDGLGNPKGNEIHNCQAKRLQQAVDRIFQGQKSKSTGNSGGWWWLDTLCVPAEKDYEEEQAKAIRQMKTIYAQADSVLIIDSGLDACDDNTSTLEVLARLRLSNWIRRLWTFQEGQFAKSVYLLVGSTPRSWEELTDVANRLPREGYQRRIARELIKTPLFFPRIMDEPFVDEPEPLDPEAVRINMEVGEIPGESPFITERVLSDVFSQLSNRVATEVRDEPQCLSLLLNLNTKSVQDAVKEEDRKEEERSRTEERSDGPSEADQKESSGSNDRSSSPSEAGMVIFLRLANQAAKLMPDHLRPRGCFPPSMIFSFGRRLLTPGFRWAPQSYLYSAALKNFSSPLPLKIHDLRLGITCDRPSGVLCESGHGLRVMFPGLIITKVDSVRPVAERFIVDSSDEPIEGMPRFWRCTFAKDIQGGGRSWDDIAPTNSDSCDNMEMYQLAIIVNGFNILGSSQAFHTILVRITGKCPEGGYSVERLGRLVGCATPENDNHEWVRNPWQRVKGRWLPLTQMWCVD
jgi:hypothetical protein